ncbi:MAG: TlpA family protein disulfide reductase [Chloroflexi bacterium]|nr:TlpA family protein disulfide reductase [Chloroflexota bacterium]
MQEPPAPRSTALLDRPIARLALAAVLLAALAGAAFAVRQARGDSESSQGIAAGRTPAPTTTGGAALGPLDNARPIIKQPAPDFALLDADGNAVKLSDLRGKVVWVNFWATWCVPCKKELPDIQRLYDEKRDAGLEVLAVNVQESRDDARSFFEARALSLPLLIDGDGAVYEQYRLQGLPDSFFIDREGNIAAVQYGFLTEDKMRDRLATAGLP